MSDGFERELSEVRKKVDGLTYEIREVKTSQVEIDKKVERLNKAFFGNGKETESLIVRFIQMETTMAGAKRTWQVAQGALIVQGVGALGALIWWIIRSFPT